MDDDVLEVLRAYPQIYLACHVEHRTRGSSSTGLTSRDATFLAHVADPEGISPAALARHLGIARSTLSAALARLKQLDLLWMETEPRDTRRRLVRLTERGRKAIATSSVLDSARVADLLAGMDSEDRRRAVEGLRSLAAAARRLRSEERVRA